MQNNFRRKFRARKHFLRLECRGTSAFFGLRFLIALFRPHFEFGTSAFFGLRFLIALFRPPIATGLLTMEGFCCHSRWISSSVHHGECFQPVHLELNSSFSSLEPHLCFFFAGSFLFFWQHEHLYDFLHETEWITKHYIYR